MAGASRRGYGEDGIYFDHRMNARTALTTRPVRAGGAGSADRNRTLLPTASRDQKVRLWDPADGSCVLTVPIHHEAVAVTSVAGSLAVALWAGVLVIRSKRMGRRCRGRAAPSPHPGRYRPGDPGLRTPAGGVTPMTTPSNETDPGMRVSRGHRAVRIVVMCVVVAAILFLATASWTHG